ncbi:MAG: trigger factor [Betaproteobacteria bacterium]|jgi:trigger factor
MSLQIENLTSIDKKAIFNFLKSDIAVLRETKLKKIAKTMKMPGFRPGKIPAKLVEQQYGAQVDYEVSFDFALDKFYQLAQNENINIVSQPRLEPLSDFSQEQIEFAAYFEIFPEIEIKDFSDKELTHYTTEVTDGEVDKTIELLRSQRSSYVLPKSEPSESNTSKNGDKLTIDFVGKIDGVEFQGGNAKAYSFILGQGQMLPEFELGCTGLEVGAQKSFDVSFPDNYQSTDLAGKVAVFDVTLLKIEVQLLPELNEDFISSLGISDGGIEKVKSEIKSNLDREVKSRIQKSLKNQVMELLLNSAEFDLPNSLVKQEAMRIADLTRKDLLQRGYKGQDIPVDSELFTSQAIRNVKLGLIFNKVVDANELKASPEQIKNEIELQSKSYENPQEVTRWFYSDPNRLKEIESLVLEDNLVQFISNKTKKINKPISFDELSKLN